MKIKQIMMMFACATACVAEALTLSVKDVKIAQRYPWNGLVDIDYTVVCDDPDADVYVYPVGYDVDMNMSVAPRTLEGAGAKGKPVKAGTHRMTWNMAADMPANYNRAEFSMKIYAYAGAAPYLVVDLSPGPDAEKYDVSYLTEIPDNDLAEGQWSDEYKTSKLVLKLVVPGTFMMGTPADEPYHDFAGTGCENLHKVTISQPFYMGVFELTQKQYQLITGNSAYGYNDTYWRGDTKPAESVSYNGLRGSVLGAQWPTHNQVDATSFFGRLRSKTGITFDLPTEAQWEYTCRAGAGTALNSGKGITTNNLKEVARCYYNSYNVNAYHDYYPSNVGRYRPNAWGFYDMHGNVAEWCRDWWQTKLTAANDPKGPSTGSVRVVRGGSCTYYQVGCNYNTPAYLATLRSGARARRGYGSENNNTYMGYSTDTTPERCSRYVGFRVACYPAE